MKVASNSILCSYVKWTSVLCCCCCFYLIIWFLWRMCLFEATYAWSGRVIGFWNWSYAGSGITSWIKLIYVCLVLWCFLVNNFDFYAILCVFGVVLLIMFCFGYEKWKFASHGILCNFVNWSYAGSGIKLCLFWHNFMN